ncbi:MAG: hypothetical protein JWN49_621 [Parcubacteria group bacterium]|nr:hypothetical protein [Parcubacteria group bacterium]
MPMATFIERSAVLVSTAAKLAGLQGRSDEEKILQKAKVRLVETGYDNWNGGITLYTLMLEIPLKMYSKIEGMRKEFEISIRDRIADITRTESDNSISDVVITPILFDESVEEESTDENNETETLPSFWQPGYFRLFISHSSAVKTWAHTLKKALAGFQVAAFVAHDDIEPSLEWQSEIESALRTMDALAAIITPRFSTSKWCDQEVGFALGKEKLVVPLTTEASPHGFLGKIQALKIKDLPASEVANKIVDILLKNTSSSPRMTEALVDSLVNSASWDASRRIMTVLEKVPALNQTQIARLITASEENIDVKQAFMGHSTVPERIQLLIERLSK